MTPESHRAGAVARGASYDGGAALVVDELNCVANHAATLLTVRLQRKRNLTRGMITAGKIVGMDERSWFELEHPWERVRWSRLHWQRKTGGAATARAAAESLHMAENTYSAYERAPGASKHTPLDHQRAVEFGRKFKVNWVWMLTGDESPFERTPAQMRALELMATVDEDEQERVVDIVEAAIRRRA